MGPQLGNNLLNLRIEAAARAALAELGQDFDEVVACEPEPGLGNGGLGRLAACYLDSLATSSGQRSGTASATNSASSSRNSATAGRSNSPTTGWRTETLGRSPNRRLLPRQLGGHTEHYIDDAGADASAGYPSRSSRASRTDTPIQGYGVHTCNVLTLWSARAVESFALDAFNTGDYYKGRRGGSHLRDRHQGALPQRRTRGG